MVQEIDDSSFLKTIELRAVFEKSTLIEATIIVHIFMNIIVVIIFSLFTKLFMTRFEADMFGCITMYFICAYEFLFHILRWMSLFMGLLNTFNNWRLIAKNHLFNI